MIRWINFSLAASFLALRLAAQPVADIVRTDKGETVFYSKSAGPARDIYAIDKTGEVRFNPTNGRLEVKLQMKHFSLPKPLMQKHYNERYMLTDRFPEATFVGKIDDWQKGVGEEKKQVTASGDFTVRGVTQPKKIQGTITKKGSIYLLTAEFDVKLEDHAIPIPELFFTKITESVRVTVNYELSP